MIGNKTGYGFASFRYDYLSSVCDLHQKPGQLSFCLVNVNLHPQIIGLVHFLVNLLLCYFGSANSLLGSPEFEHRFDP